jgi:D-hexose-6-phosphate mutarotase
MMNPTFTRPGRIRVLPPTGELTRVELRHPRGCAQVTLQGAQVIHYQPDGQAPTLWLSESSRFERGHAIRGGIPVCWPWFGDHPRDPALPAHGLARTRPWRVLESAADEAATQLRLGLTDDPTTRALWPYRFNLELLIRLDHQLTLTLTTHNPNKIPLPISEALHSYLAVSDIDRVSISGLEGCPYRDKLDHLRSRVQEDALIIDRETDRVYGDTDATVTVADPGHGRHLRVHKSGSRSTVIWNPWQERAQAMGDFDDPGFRRMLCVEAANALENTLQIPPGGSHSLTTRIQSVADTTRPA